MKVDGKKLELKGTVVESRMTKGALYMVDERGLANYPGMFQSLGLDWEVGTKLKIVIEPEEP